MLRYAGLWRFLGYGYWAIEEQASGQFIGELGFADFKRDGVPMLDGVPELGWALVPQAHGKGFATESVRAALAWADDHVNEPRTMCLINVDNAPSIRVAEKTGYQQIASLSYAGAAALVFERRRPQRSPRPKVHA